MRKLCNRKGGCGGKGGGKVEWETNCDVFILRSESDLKIRPEEEEEVETRPLTKEAHMATVLSNWEFSRGDTAHRMAAMFDRGLCYGVFSRGGRLASWVCTMRWAAGYWADRVQNRLCMQCNPSYSTQNAYGKEAVRHFRFPTLISQRSHVVICLSLSRYSGPRL